MKLYESRRFSSTYNSLIDSVQGDEGESFVDGTHHVSTRSERGRGDILRSQSTQGVGMLIDLFIILQNGCSEEAVYAKSQIEFADIGQGSNDKDLTLLLVIRLQRAVVDDTNSSLVEG